MISQYQKELFILNFLNQQVYSVDDSMEWNRISLTPTPNPPSRKGFSTAWLAHQLSVLDDDKDQRRFDSIIYCTRYEEGNAIRNRVL